MKDKILKLRAKGKTYNEIVDIVGCAKSTVSYYCGTKPKWERYEINIDLLKEAVNNSYSLSEVIKRLGLNIGGSTYEKIRRELKEHNISIEHFKGKGWSKGKENINSLSKTKFMKKYLKVLDYKPNTHRLKLRLYKFNLKKENCESCGIGSWRGGKLSLHLDHINGNNKDNRLENLQVLCPNCHSQTDTYAGKNIGAYGGTR